jgi:hypothetical protein
MRVGGVRLWLAAPLLQPVLILPPLLLLLFVPAAAAATSAPSSFHCSPLSTLPTLLLLLLINRYLIVVRGKICFFVLVHSTADGRVLLDAGDVLTTAEHRTASSPSRFHFSIFFLTPMKTISLSRYTSLIYWLVSVDQTRFPHAQFKTRDAGSMRVLLFQARQRWRENANEARSIDLG